VPWNRHRALPWKRLLTFELAYVGLFAAFLAVFRRDDLASSAVAMGVAIVVTTIAIAVLYKFGWDPAFLKTRTELASVREERIRAREAARARKAGRPEPQPERYRPAPTKRTSTGATNRPRRTSKTRKR
jgi:hypothetical protein